MSTPNKKEYTAVEYVAVVIGKLINFAERQPMDLKQTPAEWKRECSSYIRGASSRLGTPRKR